MNLLPFLLLRLYWLGILASLLLPTPRAWAQEAYIPYMEALEIVDSAQAPRVDGILDDTIWLFTTPMQDFVVQLPAAEGPARIATEVKLAFDAHFLYIGLRAFDHFPEEIRANSGRRDHIEPEHDRFTIFIAANDDTPSQFFSINAHGTLADGLYYSQNNRLDTTPDFEFVGAAQVDAQGFTAELKIPLAQLRVHQQARVWSLVVLRYQLRATSFGQQMRSPVLVRNAQCFLCIPSQAGTAAFWPQGYAALLDLQTSLLSQANWLPPEKALKDVQFRLRPNEFLSLEGSLRPGNGNSAELPAQHNSQGQFAQAHDEDRPFFLAHADLFSWLAEATPNANYTVYTRSIADQSWGVRAASRGNRADAVWLAASDNGGGQVLLPSPYATHYAPQPASLVSIAHARLHFQNLKLGALFSERDYHALGYNRVLGPNFSWQLSPQSHLRAQWLHSQTTARVNTQGLLEKQDAELGDAQRIDYLYRSREWELNAFTERVSPGFRTDNGFYGQAGYVMRHGQLLHKLGAHAGLQDVNLILRGNDTRDWQGNILQRGLRPALRLDAARDTSLFLELASGEQQRAVAGGRLHRLSFLNLELSSAPTSWLPFTAARLNLGEKVNWQTDQKVNGGSFELRFTLKPMRQLDVKLYWLREWIKRVTQAELHSPQQSTRATQLQLAWHIDHQTSLRLAFGRGQTTRNPLLSGQTLELMPFESSNSLFFQKRVGAHLEMMLGISRSRVAGVGNDAWLRFNLLF